MPLGNPLPVFIGIALMAGFGRLLDFWFPLLEDASSAHRKTLPLDGLRGILAPMVFFHHASIGYILFHTGQWSLPSSNFYNQLGPAAVTVFFFISGHLFWRKILRDPASVKLSVLIPNRIRRIMPAYLAATFALFLLSFSLTGFRILVPYTALGFEILCWFFGGFPVPGGPAINTVDPRGTSGGIFWTLQLEWMFYFLLPALAWFRPLRRLPLLVLLVYIVGKLLFHVPATGPLAVGISYMLQNFCKMFLFGFSIGMLSAYKITSARINALLCSRWMVPVGILMTAAALFMSPAHTNYTRLLLAPVFFMVVAGNDFGGVLSSRPLRALGAVSYSFYVFHGMVLRVLLDALNHVLPIRSMTPLQYWLWILPIGLVVVLWSAVSYTFIERPFFVRRKSPIPAAA